MSIVLPPLPPPSGSSVSSADFEQTFRLDQVLVLLIGMIQVLQGVAVVQAQRLQLLTNWQQAYTALLNKVPVFTSQSTIFGGTSTAQNNSRDDENRVNSTYSQQLQSESSQLSDTAKALQANLSQTNDAVTQQSNMATAILQELSTILSTIYR